MRARYWIYSDFIASVCSLFQRFRKKDSRHCRLYPISHRVCWAVIHTNTAHCQTVTWNPQCREYTLCIMHQNAFAVCVAHDIFYSIDRWYFINANAMNETWWENWKTKAQHRENMRRKKANSAIQHDRTDPIRFSTGRPCHTPSIASRSLHAEHSSMGNANDIKNKCVIHIIHTCRMYLHISGVRTHHKTIVWILFIE